jgi:hypothetical protein
MMTGAPVGQGDPRTGASDLPAPSRPFLQFPLQLERAHSDYWREGYETKGAGKTLTIDPFHVRKFSEWSDADFDLADLELPAGPQWNRCGAVHCIDRGPWIGTLVCCIRRSGHEDGHSMSLGDEGAPDYWRETWQ